MKNMQKYYLINLKGRWLQRLNSHDEPNIKDYDTTWDITKAMFMSSEEELNKALNYLRNYALYEDTFDVHEIFLSEPQLKEVIQRYYQC